MNSENAKYESTATTWAVDEANGLSDLEARLNHLAEEGFAIQTVFLLRGLKPEFVMLANRPEPESDRLDGEARSSVSFYRRVRGARSTPTTPSALIDFGELELPPDLAGRPLCSVHRSIQTFATSLTETQGSLAIEQSNKTSTLPRAFCHATGRLHAGNVLQRRRVSDATRFKPQREQ